MNGIEKEMNGIIFTELNSANEKFPLFNSAHQGYAVIKEEIEETMDGMNLLLELFSSAWLGIKKDEPVFEQIKAVREIAKNVATEAIQVAAMCDKFNMSLANGDNVDHCVSCGAVIPEGSHICYKCKTGGKFDD